MQPVEVVGDLSRDEQPVAGAELGDPLAGAEDFLGSFGQVAVDLGDRRGEPAGVGGEQLDATGRAGSRARRKKALTAQSSSRWAGAITRTSEDQVRLAGQNLRAERNTLQARIRRIEVRLPVPAGGKAGRVRGYATPAGRHAKTVRLHALKARLARVDRQLEAGAVSVVRGGKTLLRKRGNLAVAGLTEAPLALAGLPASQRDGRLRSAISSPTCLARQHGCRAVVIEDLDFTGAREQGREHHGRRPSAGRRGRGFRRLVAGIPTGKFRDRLTQMAANAGLSVIAVDPAGTAGGASTGSPRCGSRLPRSPLAITRPQ